MMFLGRGGAFLVGPSDERWDAVNAHSAAQCSGLLAFASDEGYLAGIGTELPALEDSRLLPLVEGPMADVFV